MTYSRFDVALTRFPFTERRGQKVRPVVVLTDPAFHQAHNHLIAGMITTAARSEWPTDTSIEHYRSAGLRTPCVVRLKLFTLQLDLIFGRVGALTMLDRDRVSLALTRAILPT